MLGFPFPDFSVHELQVTLRGIQRLAQHHPQRAPPPPPITPQLLSTLVSCGVDFDPSDVTFSCAFLFAFVLFTCISNLVLQSLVASGVHDYKRIYRGDIVPIRLGQQVLELPLVRVPNSPLCAVHMFYLMCEFVPAPDSVPLFVLPSRSGRCRPVLKSQFVSVLRNRLQSAGVPQSHLFQGHSFRRGGTSWAFSSSIPGEVIQAFGEWC